MYTPPCDVYSGENSMTRVLLNPLLTCDWTTLPSLPTPRPTHLKVGGRSLITVHVSVTFSPAVGFSVEASILTSLVKEAASNRT